MNILWIVFKKQFARYYWHIWSSQNVNTLRPIVSKLSKCYGRSGNLTVQWNISSIYCCNLAFTVSGVIHIFLWIKDGVFHDKCTITKQCDGRKNKKNLTESINLPYCQPCLYIHTILWRITHKPKVIVRITF